MWDKIIGILSLLWDVGWDVVTDSRVDDAKKEAHELAAKLSQEANMWQSWFWIAVIIIAVLAFIIMRKNTDDRE